MRNCKGIAGALILLGIFISSGGCTVRMGDEYAQSQPQSQTVSRSQRLQLMWKKFDELMVEGRFEEAIQEADRLLDLFGSYDKGYNNRAVAYWNLNQYDQAISDMNKAVALSPQKTSFYNNRGWLYLETENIDSAISDFEKIIQIDQTKPLGYDNLGWAYKKSRMYEQALSYFNKAIDLAPDAYQYRRGRAQTYASQGKFDLALADIDTCIEGNPKVSPYHSDRSLYHWMKGNYDLAIQDANSAMRISIENPEALAVRGLVRWMKGQREGAVQDLRTSLNIKSKSPFDFLYLGYFLHEQGQTDEAGEQFSRALELDPEIIAHTQTFGDTATAETTREFYKKLEAVAEMYTQGEGPVQDYPIREEEVMGEEFVPSEISFIVESIEIQPNPVPPGGDFALKVKCLVADPDVKESKVALQFTYKILKDEEVVRKKTNRLSVPHGKTATLKNNLVAGRTAGTYKIQIILYYKDKIAGKSANLVIGGKL